MGTAIAHPLGGQVRGLAPSRVSPRDEVRRVAVYVHFPWCLAKCPYCDFVSYASPRDEIDHDGYAEAIIAELDRRAASLDAAAHGPVQPGGRGVRGLPGAIRVGSVFFGGGT